MTESTLWLSPTGFVTGDPTLSITYPSAAQPAVEVRASAPGDLKWIYLGLNLASTSEILAVRVCYQLTHRRSFIFQVRLAEMEAPDRVLVRHDDPTNLTSVLPDCYHSSVAAYRPAGATLLSLRLSFATPEDVIKLGAIAVEYRSFAAELDEATPVPTDLPLTRAPIPFEWNGAGGGLERWHSKPDLFAAYLAELREYPPALIGPDNGFHGNIGNLMQWGPLRGSDAIYGPTSTIGAMIDTGLPSADEVATRLDALRSYLAQYDGVCKIMPYGDFATQLYGRHTDRAGFWAFYDRWVSYAAPEGPLDLGERPPEPRSWIRGWWNPATSSVCDHPPELWATACPEHTPEELEAWRGMSFQYAPKKTKLYSAHHRYSVCVNTEGWRIWWRQIYQWIAKAGYSVAGVDNAVFDACWNEECQAGYRAWLTDRFGAAEAPRLFGALNSLDYHHKLEQHWFQTADGRWRTQTDLTASNGRLYPDIDSAVGLYSARFEHSADQGLGTLNLPRRPRQLADVPEGTRDLQLNVRYKTEGDIQVVLELEYLDDGLRRVARRERLALTATWASHMIRETVPQTRLRLRFQVEGTGVLWVDELVIRLAGDEGEPAPRLATPDDTCLSQRPWQWATAQYWDSLVDDKLWYLREAGREINPEFQLFANSYFPRRGADYFAVEDQAHGFEQSRQDIGHPPGLYQPHTSEALRAQLRERVVEQEQLNTNIFDYKYTYARRLVDFPSYHMQLHASPRQPVAPVYSYTPYGHNTASALLAHAEAAAFGAGAGVDLGLRRIEYARYSAEQIRALREVGRRFFSFVAAHGELYENLWTYGEVGLILPAFYAANQSHKLSAMHELLDLSQALASRGVLWDLLTEERRTPDNLGRYKALLYHKLERLPEAEASALGDYMREGGMVIASGEAVPADPRYPLVDRYVGMFDELYRLRAANPHTLWPPVGASLSRAGAYPVGSGQLISVPGGVSLDELTTHIDRHLAAQGQPGALSVFPELDPDARARLRVAAWQGPRQLAMHILNYNVPLGPERAGEVRALRDLAVAVRLPGSWRPARVRLCTPEGDESADRNLPFTIDARLIRFTIPELSIYTVAAIE